MVNLTLPRATSLPGFKLTSISVDNDVHVLLWRLVASCEQVACCLDDTPRLSYFTIRNSESRSDQQKDRVSILGRILASFAVARLFGSPVSSFFLSLAFRQVRPSAEWRRHPELHQDAQVSSPNHATKRACPIYLALSLDQPRDPSPLLICRWKTRRVLVVVIMTDVPRKHSRQPRILIHVQSKLFHHRLSCPWTRPTSPCIPITRSSSCSKPWHRLAAHGSRMHSAPSSESPREAADATGVL